MKIDAVTSKINRRAVLAGVPATIATTAADGSTVDPHPEWLTEWRTVNALWLDAGEADPEGEKLWAERERLGLLICNTPATTAAGVLAQYQWFQADFGYIFDEMVSPDYEGIFDALLAGLERLASAPRAGVI